MKIVLLTNPYVHCSDSSPLSVHGQKEKKRKKKNCLQCGLKKKERVRSDYAALRNPGLHQLPAFWKVVIPPPPPAAWTLGHMCSYCYTGTAVEHTRAQTVARARFDVIFKTSPEFLCSVTCVNAALDPDNREDVWATCGK